MLLLLWCVIFAAGALVDVIYWLLSGHLVAGSDVSCLRGPCVQIVPYCVLVGCRMYNNLLSGLEQRPITKSTIVIISHQNTKTEYPREVVPPITGLWLSSKTQ